ncbi:hypothetical protein M2161_002666 [Streptomyces sp. SAI-133]|uniref:hypothetical protein n=1 Tax=unclassified Streptomyces TaxID=2593676 RepID=UPI0024740866|nr:hypothetical protein [Streptomyces sp. SAI-133]MDH6583560.1 hypothetical protein [Streptomyces sp. SAI-133]
MLGAGWGTDTGLRRPRSRTRPTAAEDAALARFQGCGSGAGPRRPEFRDRATDGDAALPGGNATPRTHRKSPFRTRTTGDNTRLHGRNPITETTPDPRFQGCATDAGPRRPEFRDRATDGDAALPGGNATPRTHRKSPFRTRTTGDDTRLHGRNPITETAPDPRFPRRREFGGRGLAGADARAPDAVPGVSRRLGFRPRAIADARAAL